MIAAVNPQPFSDSPDAMCTCTLTPLIVFQVELATGEFPYRNCTTEFEVLSRVMSEDPPQLPREQGFSKNLNTFVRTW